MTQEYGASLVIAVFLNHSGVSVFPVVYSDQKESQHKTMYWKFAAGRIEVRDFPDEIAPDQPSPESLTQAAMNAARREFFEETSIPLDALAEIELAKVVRKRTHLLYVHLAKLHQNAQMPKAGLVGKTGDRISYFTARDILHDQNFMPAHRDLFIEITRG